MRVESKDTGNTAGRGRRLEISSRSVGCFKQECWSLLTVQEGSKLEGRVLAVLLGSEWTAGRAGRMMAQAEEELQPWNDETNGLVGNPSTEGGTGTEELEHGG